MKKPALKDLKAAHPELPQHELNKLYTRSKIRYVDTREKRSRVELASMPNSLANRHTGQVRPGRPGSSANGALVTSRLKTVGFFPFL